MLNKCEIDNIIVWIDAALSKEPKLKAIVIYCHLYFTFRVAVLLLGDVDGARKRSIVKFVMSNSDR